MSKKFLLSVCLFLGFFVVCVGSANALYNRVAFKTKESKSKASAGSVEHVLRKTRSDKSVWKVLESDVATLKNTADILRADEPQMASQIDEIAARLSVLVEPEEEDEAAESSVEPEFL